MKKKVIISISVICILCIALVRLLTPYLGKPFFIYCNAVTEENGTEKDFYLSNKVKKIKLFSANEPCIKYIRYCSELEELSVLCYPETIDIADISNPNIKRLFVGGNCVNWSSLNQCTELRELEVCFSNYK